MFLRDGKLGVTFPWGGVLIKTGIEGELRAEVLAHEMCHVEQSKKYGVLFIVEYARNMDKFELECYKISNSLKNRGNTVK